MCVYVGEKNGTIKNDLPKLYINRSTSIRVKLTNKDNKRKLNCFLCCFYCNTRKHRRLENYTTICEKPKWYTYTTVKQENNNKKINFL